MTHQREDCVAQASICREKAQSDPVHYGYWIDEAIGWRQRIIGTHEPNLDLSCAKGETTQTRMNLSLISEVSRLLLLFHRLPRTRCLIFRRGVAALKN
jgi:hypothetical protein